MGRYQALDGLRALAAIMVLGVHFFPPYEADDYFANHIVVDAIISFVRSGLIGVDLFFVISAFLVWGALSRSNHSWFGFLAWRSLRLLPAHIAVLAVIGLGGIPAADILLNVSLVGHFANGFLPVNNVTWSLAWEWAFYLLAFPACLAIRALRLQVRWVAIILLGITVCGALVVFSDIAKDQGVSLPLGGRFASFFIGMLVAEFYRNEDAHAHRLLQLRRTELAAVVALILLQGVWASQVLPADPFWRNGYFLAVGLTSGVIVGGIASGQWVVCRTLCLRGLRMVGRASYSFYLIHVVVGIAAAQAIIRPTSFAQMMACYALSIIITSAASLLMYAIFEWPYFALRRRSKRARPGSGQPGVVEIDAPKNVPTTAGEIGAKFRSVSG